MVEQDGASSVSVSLAKEATLIEQIIREKNSGHVWAPGKSSVARIARPSNIQGVYIPSALLYNKSLDLTQSLQGKIARHSGMVRNFSFPTM